MVKRSRKRNVLNRRSNQYEAESSLGYYVELSSAQGKRSCRSLGRERIVYNVITGPLKFCRSFLYEVEKEEQQGVAERNPEGSANQVELCRTTFISFQFCITFAFTVCIVYCPQTFIFVESNEIKF